MAEHSESVAILVPNAALSSVIGMVLGSAPALSVRHFVSRAELAAHMLDAPVDLLIYDFDDGESVDEIAIALKQRGAQVIALTGSIDSDSRRRAAAAGIDEVIVKPMSPKFLLERVQSRLASRR